jgi:Protein of unknown function (DUF4238)
MKSHTIPARLLRQFAYFDPITKSQRLWKYSKGIPPDPKASPKTATRIDGYFENPSDEKTENLIETKLAQDIEDPVHKFIAKFDDPLWTMTIQQRHQMIRYISLLFNRSAARKQGTKHTSQIMGLTVERFISNETKLLTVAAQWSLNHFFRGQSMLFKAKDIVNAAKNVLTKMQTETSRQESYVDFIKDNLSQSLTPTADEAMAKGEWRFIRTNRDTPFILSDTPVITWARVGKDFDLGIGFERPNVEVILPISPMTCLQILPDVKRTTSPIPPTVSEVNIIQASFARQSCFADRKSDDIDKLVQENINKLRMGENVFTLWHRNFDEKFYDIMMSVGKV